MEIKDIQFQQPSTSFDTAFLAHNGAANRAPGNGLSQARLVTIGVQQIRDRSA